MLRKEKEVIARGNIEFMEVENAGVLAYTRCLDKQKLLVCCNFRDVESQMEIYTGMEVRKKNPGKLRGKS